VSVRSADSTFGLPLTEPTVSPLTLSRCQFPATRCSTFFSGAPPSSGYTSRKVPEGTGKETHTVRPQCLGWIDGFAVFVLRRQISCVLAARRTLTWHAPLLPFFLPPFTRVMRSHASVGPLFACHRLCPIQPPRFTIARFPDPGKSQLGTAAGVRTRDVPRKPLSQRQL